MNTVRPVDTPTATVRDAASDPLGVGDVYAHEIQAAMLQAIETYLGENPTDWDSFRLSKLIKDVANPKLHNIRKEHERTRRGRLHFLDALTASIYETVDVNTIKETLAESLSHMQGGTVERESAEDSLHRGGASDLLDQPTELDWARPGLFEANVEDFESAEIQQKAMDAVRDMLKAKIASSTAAYDEKVKTNPLEPVRGELR